MALLTFLLIIESLLALIQGKKHQTQPHPVTQQPHMQFVCVCLWLTVSYHYIVFYIRKAPVYECEGEERDIQDRLHFPGPASCMDALR